MTQLPVNGCQILTLPVRSDERGSLVALEAGAPLPFELKRAYYIFGTPAGAERGFHAHRALIQWAMCLAGACTITVDDGSERADVRLDTPGKALEIGAMVWHEMRDFTPDAVLLLVADAPYDECDYVRDYDEFLRLARS